MQDLEVESFERDVEGQLIGGVGAGVQDAGAGAAATRTVRGLAQPRQVTLKSSYNKLADRSLT